MSNQEIIIPEMVRFETLTKIIIGYLKVQADKEPKSYSEVAKIAKVSKDNVRRNTNFLVSIGVLEGERGQHKLTPMGKKYAQALDWGKLDEANRILRELLVDKELIQRILGFVDINQPVEKEELLRQIAVIAGVPNASRFRTGIKACIDMLVTSGLVDEDPNKNTYSRTREHEVSREKRTLEEYIEARKPMREIIEPKISKERFAIPITISFTIDNQTSEENLKKLLRAIREVFQEE